ncbi:MAG: hypothetical protein LBH59_07630 [Planctomycetaceae bacterium]|jgi:hypothetical protein|nr:hypothetical protein [Planctomycetaceae bacterium]
MEKIILSIPKPVWAVGFALEQTLHVVTLVVTLTVFSYVDFKVASAYQLVKKRNYDCLPKLNSTQINIHSKNLSIFKKHILKLK